MKKIMSILFFIGFVTSACSLKGNVPENPTGNPELDVYLSKWIDSPNITACERVLDKEYGIDAVLCVETMTDRKINIPFSEWENNNLEDLFLKVSKRDIRNFINKNDDLREKLCAHFVEFDCSNNKDYPPMEELVPYVEAE